MALARREKPAVSGPAAPSRSTLTLSCADRIGIVHAVSAFFVEHALNILESQQFGDPDSGRFFMRVEVSSTTEKALGELGRDFEPIARRFAMQWTWHDQAQQTRVVVLVSKLGHCLNDLLFRAQTGSLRAEIVAVVSNHADLAPLAAAYGVPYDHLPITPANRAAQEQALAGRLTDVRADLVVLARYMQVLSGPLCGQYHGRMINIHHSFLPSFKGARPYHQAHQRGVKLIGATAHYVTPALDEGPIIEQEVARVDHSLSPAALMEVGRDLECVALARAVRWHAEKRVLLNGDRTVVFR
ncbi:MAG: formyltetrahydrofolate deformylase [Candidatus Dormibacteria bacterium]